MVKRAISTGSVLIVHELGHHVVNGQSARSLGQAWQGPGRNPGGVRENPDVEVGAAVEVDKHSARIEQANCPLPQPVTTRPGPPPKGPPRASSGLLPIRRGPPAAFALPLSWGGPPSVASSPAPPSAGVGVARVVGHGPFSGALGPGVGRCIGQDSNVVVNAPRLHPTPPSTDEVGMSIPVYGV